MADSGTAGRRKRADRPAEYFDVGLQHERTALAWERTAIAMMVAGATLARYAANDAHPLISVIGVAEVAAGGGILMWSGHHYEQLHGPLRAGTPVVHPTATRFIGTVTIVCTAAALVLAVLVAFLD